MDKKKYDRAEMEIIMFQTEDVIVTSGERPNYEEDETTLIK